MNADQIALQFRMDPYRAAKVAEALRKKLVSIKESFIFETVFSDPVGDKLAFLLEAQQSGYTVALFFIGVDGSETSRERVAMRVLKGGHDVPSSKLESRYHRTNENLRRALLSLPYVAVYDNNNLLQPYRLVAEVRERVLRTFDPVQHGYAPCCPEVICVPPFTLRVMAEEQEKRYDPAAIEPKWQERWARTRRCMRLNPLHAAKKILCAGDAALSERTAAHGARSQLLDRRRAGAAYVDARL